MWHALSQCAEANANTASPPRCGASHSARGAARRGRVSSSNSPHHRLGPVLSPSDQPARVQVAPWMRRRRLLPRRRLRQGRHLQRSRRHRRRRLGRRCRMRRQSQLLVRRRPSPVLLLLLRRRRRRRRQRRRLSARASAVMNIKHPFNPKPVCCCIAIALKLLDGFQLTRYKPGIYQV